jgi:hypothetical protein
MRYFSITHRQRAILTSFLVCAAAMSLMAAERSDDLGTTKNIAFEVDRTNYQSFVGKWDDEKHPVLMAYLRNAGQYDAIVLPAPVMRNDNRVGPPPSFYETKSILLVCRVLTDASLQRFRDFSLFQVDAVTITDGVITCSYRIDPEPAGAGGGYYKLPLKVVIPQTDCREVVFVENHVEVGRLNIAAGRWRIPMP